jgi:Domain of unknown function (DUF4034)
MRRVRTGPPPPSAQVGDVLPPTSDPALVALRQLLADGDWEYAEQLLGADLQRCLHGSNPSAGAAPGKSGDSDTVGHRHAEEVCSFCTDRGRWALHEQLIKLCSTWKGKPAVLEQWVSACPESAVAHCVLGAHAVLWAWEARGSGWASTVGEDGFHVMFERLRRAEFLLQRSSALAKHAYPTPLAFSVNSGMRALFPLLTDGILSKVRWQ